MNNQPKAKLFQLGKGVVKYYRNKVKGNVDAPINLIQRKLTRNIMLAYRVNEKHYIYGNLHIFVDGNTIIGLVNARKRLKGFIKDWNKYEWLNELLGIRELERELNSKGDINHETNL
jgi:hypothetical protein